MPDDEAIGARVVESLGERVCACRYPPSKGPVESGRTQDPTVPTPYSLLVFLLKPLYPPCRERLAHLLEGLVSLRRGADRDQEKAE